MLDGLAPPDSLHDLLEFVGVVRRDEDRERQADDLLGAVTIQSLRSPVPAGDDPVEALADDGIVGRLHDGGQAQAGLRGPACLGHVPKDQDRPADAPIAPPDRGGGFLNGHFPPVPGDQGGVVGQLARQPVEPRALHFPKDLADRVLDRLAGFLVEDAKDSLQGLPGRLPGTPAGQPRRHRIEEGHVPAPVRDDHGVRDAGQGDVQLLALPVDLLGGHLRGPACGLLLQQPAGVLLGQPAFRQVSGDLGETPQRAFFVAQGGDDDVGPEAGAVLAHPPALVLDAPLGRRPPQFLLGPAPLDGLLGVEAGEVLADDLLGPVALDALRPAVPGGDPALRVEHEDGVVLDALDHQAEAIFTEAEFLLGLLAIGQVPGDLQEAPDRAGLVAQGGDDDVGPEAGAVLAHPPALVLDAPLGRRPLQFLLGPAPLDGLLRVEAGEMLADDLLGPVALDALRPGVPGEDVPLLIEKEDRIIAHAGDQLPEVFLAFAQPGLGAPLSGDRGPQGPPVFRRSFPAALPGAIFPGPLSGLPLEQFFQELEHGPLPAPGVRPGVGRARVTNPAVRRIGERES